MEIPWTTTGRSQYPGPAADASIMASRFELTSGWRSPAFLARSLRVWRQVRRSPGALGVSLRAQPLKGTFWTLSAWTDRDALSSFARAEPHRAVMRATRPWMKDSVFRFWTAPASQLNPAQLWADAQARIAASDPPASEIMLGLPMSVRLSADALDPPDADRGRDGHHGGRPEQGRVAGQVWKNASSSAAAAISRPDTVTSILRRPLRSETIPPMIEVSTTQPV
jgi:hypothetical protein